MRLHSKLGNEMSATQLISIILMLATAVVVFFLLLSMRSSISGSADHACATAVREQDFQNRFIDASLVKDIKGCPTEEIAIEGSTLSSNRETAETKVKLLLAEEMRKCWQEWGEGKLTLFKEDGEYCHVCSTITFDAQAQSKLGTIDDFSGYLQKTKSPNGKTYAQLLLGYENIEEEMRLDAPPYYVNPGQQQAVVFWYSKTKTASSILQKATFGSDSTPLESAGAGGVAGVLVAGTLYLVGAPVTIPVTAAGAGLGGAIALVDAWTTDDFNVLSATFLIPETPSVIESYGCAQAASPTESP